MNADEIISKARTIEWAPQSHDAGDGKACIMEAIAWAAGEPWSDFPRCVPHEVARLCQRIHDNADPSEYGRIWTDERLRAVLAAKHGDDASVKRAYIAAADAAAAEKQQYGADDDAKRQEARIAILDAWCAV